MKIPRNLGRYEVVDLIGQGGMGALYRARDPRIGRYVAIKLLRQGYDTPELRDRFSREAIAAGSLSHPNIVTIYDVGEHDGLPFIAMEYVRGETFADLVCLRPPLSIPRKLQLTEEVCAGLAHAHEAGIVHRDIKPANLIVGPEGTVKILDFGIAKLSATGITLPGAIMGTLNYMSPEQVKGIAVDARADIFSVGAVLYELLSHQLAFPGQLPDEVFHQILTGVPTPITEYCPDLDPRLVRLVDQALEKDPDDRFENVAAVQRELAAIRLNPHGAVIAPPPPIAPRKTPSPAVPDPAKIRAHQIDEHLIAARRAFEADDHDAAIESCKQVLMLDASDERALSQLARIHEAIDAQQTMIRSTIERGRAEYEGGNLLSALRDVKRVLDLDPENSEAQALAAAAEAAVKERQEEARIRAGVDDARRRFGNGEHEAALQALEALGPASHPIVASTLVELRVALLEIEEQQRIENERLELQRRIEAERLELQRRLEAERVERQQRIAALLAEARAALKGQRLDDASQALEQVREIDATVPELSDLTERLLKAEAAARLKEELQQTLGEFDEQLAKGDLARAGELLTAATALVPAHSLVRSARKRFDEAVAVVAAREAAEARRREGEQKIEDAARSFEAGDLTGAGDLLRLAAQLVPQHPRAIELSEQLREAVARKEAAEAAERLRRQIEELIRSASQRLQSADDNANDLTAALREVNQVLALDAGHAEAQQLKTAIEEAITARREAARARTAISNARSRFANGKHQAALKLLEDYQPASHPEITATLAELRAALLEIEEQRRLERERIERQQRVAALLVEGRTALRDQRFDEALRLLAAVEEIDAAVPDLPLLREQLRQEQAAAQLRAELERVLGELDEQLTRGDLSAASELLNTAAGLSPTDGRVLAMRRRTEQAIAASEAAAARARELEEKSDAAEALFGQGDLDGAMRLLTLAASLDPQHARSVAIAARVSDAIKARDAAEAAERLRKTVDELLDGAEAQLQAPDRQPSGVALAIQQIAKAQALAPDDARAQALKATADEAAAAVRETARIETAIRNARSRFANGKHQSAVHLLENLDASTHPAVAETLKELRALIHAMQEQRRAEKEQAERQARVAEHLTIARAAINERRFSEAVDALSAARAIDATADGLAELTEQAIRSQAQEVRKTSGAAPLEKRDRAQTPTGRQRVAPDRMAPDEEATVFIPVERSTGERDRASIGLAAEGMAAAEERTLVGAAAEHEAEPRPWRWGVIAGAAILLLVILAVLLRLWS